MSRAVDFCTRLYFGVHGKQPRGRGSWAFEFQVRVARGTFRMPPAFAPGVLSLTEAKAWAARQAAGYDLIRIVVLP